MSGRNRVGLALLLVILIGGGIAAFVTIDRADETSPLVTLADAIDRTASGSYTYLGDVRIVTDAGPTTMRLEGRVQPGRREVTVRTSDERTITFRFEDGVVTLDRGDGPQPAPAGRSLDATSLDILRQLDRLVLVAPGRYQGELRGDLLLEPLSPSAVVAADSKAIATIDVDTDQGVLRGYTVTEHGGAWRIDLRFADVRPSGEVLP